MEAATTADYKGLYEDIKPKYDALFYEVAQLKKMIFGSRHERFVSVSPDSSQLALDLAVEAIATAAQTEKITVTQIITKSPSQPIVHPGRSPLPAHLRREEVILEPATVPEGSKKIGEEITEELEYDPAELFVKKYIRPKYAVPATDATGTTIIIAPMPVRPIDKAIAGPGLLAQIVIDKYIDHLPLYRQMQRFERSGVKLSDSTVSNWISEVCKLLMPLYEALKQQIINSGYIHVDETTIKVLDSSKKGTTHRGYFWVYNNSPGRLVFFDYREGRDGKGISELLANYQGYLQTDGYQVYDGFDEKAGIIQLNCMAHARRKFFEAKDNDGARSAYAMEQMQLLYALEQIAQEYELSYAERLQLRQKMALPILQNLGKWMKTQYMQVLPKSPIGLALSYSIVRWDKLCIYATNGMLHIDNNPVENSIRPVAIGRKNYLFAGSHEGAKRSAMLYSLLGTCKLHNVNPLNWLTDVLITIPYHPINKIKELLPHNFKPKQN